MLLRRPLLLAVLSVLVSVSVALSIPSPLKEHLSPDPIKTTISSLKIPQGYPQNLTYTPWPAQPYEVPIYPRFGFPHLIIAHASEFHGTWSISLPRLQDFLQEFGDNLEREYPIPGSLPRVASQSTIDIPTYTRWTIEMNEGIFGHGLPTAVALVALDEIARQLGSHGPSSLFFSIREDMATLSYGFLNIIEFGGNFLDRSLGNKTSNFQTS